MIFIPGFLIGWATFPGVVVHEFAHKKACEWRRVRVHDVNYFDLSGGGHVQHSQPRNFSDTLAISAAPFAVNTMLAFALYTGAVLLYDTGSLFGITPSAYTEPTAVLVGWLALSVGWHAIPSFGDSGHIWRGAKRRWRSSNLALFSLPLVLFFYVGNLLAFFWFDAIYSIGIGALAYAVITGGL